MSIKNLKEIEEKEKLITKILNKFRLKLDKYSLDELEIATNNDYYDIVLLKFRQKNFK